MDGEMPPDLMRDRCEGLQASNDNLEFLNHEILFDHTGKTLNIATRSATGDHRPLHQNMREVLILDNLSIASGMKRSWELVNNWL